MDVLSITQSIEKHGENIQSILHVSEYIVRLSGKKNIFVHFPSLEFSFYFTRFIDYKYIS